MPFDVDGNELYNCRYCGKPKYASEFRINMHKRNPTLDKCKECHSRENVAWFRNKRNAQKQVAKDNAL